MKLEEIQELLNFIANSGLDEVNIESDKLKISVRRSVGQQVVTMAALPAATASAPQAAAPVQAATASPAPAAAAPAAASDQGQIQKAPMIGTFYAASSPDVPPFVKVGDRVTKGQVICIIEAMKLFNEIESDYTGTVTQVLAQNATPVEYDQPLFVIAKD